MGYTAPIEYVYFIKAGEFVKIGRTTKGIGNRIEHMQTANAHVLHCPMYIKIYVHSYYCSIGERVERLVHTICKDSHVRGEWYHYHDAMLAVYQNIGVIRRYIEGNRSIRTYKIGINGDHENATSYQVNSMEEVI